MRGNFFPTITLKNRENKIRIQKIDKMSSTHMIDRKGQNSTRNLKLLAKYKFFDKKKFYDNQRC